MTQHSEPNSIVKIPIHSITDLITNSSTTIFTYSEASEAAAKDMINEMLNVFGVNQKCDDIFSIFILCQDYYAYQEYAYDKKIPGIDKQTNFRQLFDDVAKGNIPKPEWFIKAEGSGAFQTFLWIIPKDEKYANLARQIRHFLYSTKHEEHES